MKTKKQLLIAEIFGKYILSGRYYSEDDLMEMTGCTRGTIKTYISRKKLPKPCKSIGTLRLWNKEEVDSFLEGKLTKDYE